MRYFIIHAHKLLDPGKDPVGLVCIGKCAGGPAPAKRKEPGEKTRYLD